MTMTGEESESNRKENRIKEVNLRYLNVKDVGKEKNKVKEEKEVSYTEKSGNGHINEDKNKQRNSYSNKAV